MKYIKGAYPSSNTHTSFENAFVIVKPLIFNVTSTFSLTSEIELYFHDEFQMTFSRLFFPDPKWVCRLDKKITTE